MSLLWLVLAQAPKSGRFSPVSIRHVYSSTAALLTGPSESFRSLLPQTWRYHFVNGEEPCLPADGIEDVYPEPFFCYYDVPSFENVEAAHELIHEILEDEGPFDAVLAYSQ